MPTELTIDAQLDTYRQEYQFHALKCDIPEHCQKGLIEYLVEGRPVGGFLTAIVTNDLVRAAMCADHINRFALFNYACMLHNHAPMNAWGSEEKVLKWQEHHGLRGMLGNAVASE